MESPQKNGYLGFLMERSEHGSLMTKRHVRPKEGLWNLGRNGISQYWL
jgi:hypothetical protein